MAHGIYARVAAVDLCRLAMLSPHRRTLMLIESQQLLLCNSSAVYPTQ